MRRVTMATALLALVVALSATPAWAAKTTTTTGKGQTKSSSWEAVAGLFRTEKAATEMIHRLDIKGLKGFSTEMDRQPRSHAVRYEVERQFQTEREARDEVNRLRKAGFHGQLERD
jgi:hypothetical protein